MTDHMTENDRTTCWRSECRSGCYYPEVCSEHPKQISIADLAVQPRDEVIAQVMAFLLERGYSITTPDGHPIFPSGSTAGGDPS